MKNKLNLPKSKNGIPYISYSQASSFRETNDEFRYQMILQYIFGIEVKSRFEDFAVYGNNCGEYIETKGEKRGEMLSDNDCEILDKVMKDFIEGSEYEREVWIERDGYAILGYEDRWTPTGENECEVEDFKTGNISSKRAFYSSEAYKQVLLYCYFEDTIKGNKIKDSYVTMLDRKGNPMSLTDPTKLYLTGEVEKISTPYDRARAEEFLKDLDNIALEIASLKTTYDSLKDLTIEM